MSQDKLLKDLLATTSLRKFFHKAVKYCRDNDSKIIDHPSFNTIIQTQAQNNPRNKHIWQDIPEDLKSVLLDENSELVQAIQQGQVRSLKNTVHHLMSRWGISSDQISSASQNLLHTCSQTPYRAKIIQFLLQLSSHYKPSITKKDSEGRLATHLACLAGQSIRTLKQLAKKPEDIICEDNHGWTPLCYAATPPFNPHKLNLIHFCLSYYETYHFNLNYQEYQHIHKLIVNSSPSPNDPTLINVLQLAFNFIKLHHPTDYLAPSFSEHLEKKGLDEQAFLGSYTFPVKYESAAKIIQHLRRHITSNHFYALTNKLTPIPHDSSDSEKTEAELVALSLLRVAIDQGRYSMIALLKNLSITPINLTDSHGQTLVTKAINANQPKAVQALLTCPRLEKEVMLHDSQLIDLLHTCELNSVNSNMRQQWQYLRHLCEAYNLDYQFNKLITSLDANQPEVFINTFEALNTLQGKTQTLQQFHQKMDLPLAHYLAQEHQLLAAQYLAQHHPISLLEPDQNNQSFLSILITKGYDDATTDILQLCAIDRLHGQYHTHLDNLYQIAQTHSCDKTANFLFDSLYAAFSQNPTQTPTTTMTNNWKRPAQTELEASTTNESDDINYAQPSPPKRPKLNQLCNLFEVEGDNETSLGLNNTSTPP